MDFTFTEDQLLFQESVRDFLRNEVTPEQIRQLWQSENGRSDELWGQLAELGLTAMTVPEAHGGLGMSALDFILIAIECGYVALPAPLVHSALVVVPVLSAIDSLSAEWLPKVADGSARVVISLEQNLLVEDAHIADLLILQHGDQLHALTPDQYSLRHNPSVDPSRKLYAVDWSPSEATQVASGEAAETIAAAAFNCGALGVAAESLGLAQRMIDIAVTYTAERQQFGVAIGSFQAVKHHMSNIAYKLEYAKAPLYRAAYAVANTLPSVAENVSHAKLAATEAAQIAAKNTIQVHGAMGYTWEVDLHIYMKKAWAYNNDWGDVALHQQRIGAVIFAENAALGAGNTFI